MINFLLILLHCIFPLALLILSLIALCCILISFPSLLSILLYPYLISFSLSLLLSFLLLFCCILLYFLLSLSLLLLSCILTSFSPLFPLVLCILYLISFSLSLLSLSLLSLSSVQSINRTSHLMTGPPHLLSWCDGG